MGTCTNICKLLVAVCILNQVCQIDSQASSAGNRFFRCKGGEYVRSADYCDGTKDCPDGSDETTQCKTENCGTEGRFQCTSSSKTNFTCILPKLLCDGNKDCPDGSDELDCGDQLKVHDCPLSKGKFLCNDTRRCLELEYACDGFCNCFDCSDENENCTKRDEKILSSGCSHTYFPTPSGLRCFCDSEDITLEGLCSEMKECPVKNACSQRCSQYKNKVLCSCDDDFDEIPVTNGFKCRSKQYEGTRIIYSTSNHIKSLNVTSKEATIIKKNVQSKLLAAAEGVVYYTTYRDNGTRIFSISSDKVTEIIKTNSPVVSISVDYITDNIYFTTLQQSLSVCSKDGEICIQLKCCGVTYVTVAPKYGSMFYSKKSDIPNELFIMSSSMDGSNENILIDGTFRAIKTIAVDESFAKMYWIDVSNRISSISLRDYSMDRHYISRFGNEAESFAVLDEIIFYTSNQDDKIYLQENLESFVKSTKNKFDDPVEVRRYKTMYYEYDRRPEDLNFTLYRDLNATMSIKNIVAYNFIRNYAFKTVHNPCEYAPCSGLCLLRSLTVTISIHTHYTCACKKFDPSGDDHWCTDPTLVTDSPDQNQQLENSDNEKGTSFVDILVILIALVALASGMYFIYHTYYNRMVYSRRSQRQSERIYDPGASEMPITE